jgi:D-xylose transport system substrate-binding protein
MVNGKTNDSKQNKDVPSVLLTPIWVTPKNMAATVVKDKFVDAAKLCAGDYAEKCKAAGISVE